MAIDHQTEEVLEAMWVLKEQGGTDAEGHFSYSETCRIIAALETITGGENGCAVVLDGLNDAGLVRIDGDILVWTKVGEAESRSVVRRHRLAERLLSEVFAVPAENVEENACNFEHILSPEVTESICAFLGHPPVCPHGRPIPPGACCGKFSSGMQPLVVPLRELDAGDSAKVVFISAKDPARLEKLCLFGIKPDGVIILKQKHPTYVVQAEETEIALDSEIAREIFVRKAPGGAAGSGGGGRGKRRGWRRGK